MTPASGGRPVRRGSVLRPGVEYEFKNLTLSRELSRNAVTRYLVERAEVGGWELGRLRLAADGTRRVQLRRRIIRQRPWSFVVEIG